MTKRFGVLVGAVKQLTPMRPVDMAFENSTDRLLVRDYITLAAAPIADLVSLGIFGWETVLSPGGTIWFDALGAGTTFSIGDITTFNALVNAQASNAAGSVAIGKALTLDLYFAPLWQALGYASLAAAQAVGSQCELLLKIAGGAATGKVAWQLHGAKRI